MREEHRTSQANRGIPFKTIFRLSAAESSGEVRLSSREWSILAHVNGVRTVAEIARRLHLNELELAETLFKLSSAGLVEVCEHPEVAAPPAVDGATLGQIRTAFARLMGPLAPLLLEEAIEGLGESAETLPRHRLAALIEALAEQIPDDAKRVQFQQAMLDLLKQA